MSNNKLLQFEKQIKLNLYSKGFFAVRGNVFLIIRFFTFALTIYAVLFYTLIVIKKIIGLKKYEECNNCIVWCNGRFE
jgi:hypothetical protein